MPCVLNFLFSSFSSNSRYTWQYFQCCWIDNDHGKKKNSSFSSVHRYFLQPLKHFPNTLFFSICLQNTFEIIWDGDKKVYTYSDMKLKTIIKIFLMLLNAVRRLLGDLLKIINVNVNAFSAYPWKWGSFFSVTLKIK